MNLLLHLQLCLKKKSGCNDAIFSLASVSKYFNEHKSSVFTALLKIKKAFDHVNHYKMFSSLLSAGVSMLIVDMLCEWYGKFFCVNNMVQCTV